jgi:hypothetical protein
LYGNIELADYFALKCRELAMQRRKRKEEE